LDTLREDLSTFSEVGLNQIVGDHQAIVTVSRDAVIAGYCLSLSKHRVVLEVFDDIVSYPTLKAELWDLSRMGHQVAVGNTTPESVTAAGRSVVDIVRVDVRDLSEDALAKQVDALSRLSVRLLADHVDTYEQFDLCKKHKFEMYQGYLFSSPKKTGTEIPVNRLAAVRLLGKLQDPSSSLNELEQSISTDLTLSYKLLRFANSAFIGLNRTVDSISHAAKLIGMERIRLWASLLMC
jgi:EAL and modified HD-GYP domain-containing signal transduction protein